MTPYDVTDEAFLICLYDIMERPPRVRTFCAYSGEAIKAESKKKKIILVGQISPEAILYARRELRHQHTFFGRKWVIANLLPRLDSPLNSFPFHIGFSLNSVPL